MTEYPNIVGFTQRAFLSLVANIPLHSEGQDFTFCPWCGRLEMDESGNRWSDTEVHHKEGCPVLQARTILGGSTCGMCGRWVSPDDKGRCILDSGHVLT